MHKISYTIKRICDVVLSVIAVVILSPILFILTVTVKIESKGPALFKQGRLGKDGKPFIMYKFRSMVADAEKSGAGLFNYEDDDRVTKVGRFLRNSSLDELPQLFNVIKGDMSIIGPRPCVTYELGDFETLNKRYKRRFRAVPGITGLAQVYGRNGISWDEKVNYDNEYIDRFEKEGCILDIKILFMTVKNIVSSKDIYEEKSDNSLSSEEAAIIAEQEIIRKAHEKEDEDYAFSK